MKKLLALLAVCGFVFAFVACGGKKEEAAPVEETPAVETPAPVDTTTADTVAADTTAM